MPHSVAVLQELPLLSNLPQVTVAHLAQHATERAFAKREVVLQKGSSPTALCFLLEGRLQGLDFTMDDREVGLYFVNPGDYFGEVALLDGLDTFVLAMAMAALGMTTHISALKKAGVRPLLMALVLFIWLIVGGGLINVAIHHLLP